MAEAQKCTVNNRQALDLEKLFLNIIEYAGREKQQTRRSCYYGITAQVPGNVMASLAACTPEEKIAQEVMARKHCFF